MQDSLLILFAKNPVPGQVKTRLAAAFGAREAARVYCAITEMLLAELTPPAEGAEYDMAVAFAPADAADANAVERLADGLLAEDPLLRAFASFPAPAKQRERYFLKNSLNGFLGWVREKR